MASSSSGIVIGIDEPIETMNSKATTKKLTLPPSNFLIRIFFKLT